MRPFSDMLQRTFLCHGLHSDPTTRMEGAGGYQKGSSPGKQMRDVSYNLNEGKNSVWQLALKFTEGEVGNLQRQRTPPITADDTSDDSNGIQTI